MSIVIVIGTEDGGPDLAPDPDLLHDGVTEADLPATVHPVVGREVHGGAEALEEEVPAGVHAEDLHRIVIGALRGIIHAHVTVVGIGKSEGQIVMTGVVRIVMVVEDRKMKVTRGMNINYFMSTVNVARRHDIDS